MSGAAGEKLGDETFAGAEVGDGDGGGEAEGEVADGLPGATGAVVFTEFAGDEVEVLLLERATTLEDAFEILAVGGQLGQAIDGVASGVEQGKHGSGQVGAEGVEGFFTLAAVGH